MERDGYPVTWQLNAIVYATACVYSEFQSKYIFFNLFFFPASFSFLSCT